VKSQEIIKNIGGILLEGVSYEKISESVFVCKSENHRFGTDAILLTEFSNYKPNDLVCDLGTGCGIIPLAMCRKNPPKKVYAIDIQQDAIEQVKLGIAKSHVENIVPICADLKNLCNFEDFGKLSLVTCNPPYFTANAGFKSTLDSQTIARHEVLCTIDDVCNSASRLLKFGGRLCMCNRPDRLADVLSAMKNYGIEPKTLQLVCKTPNTPPWLFLVEGKKGAKPSLKVLPSKYMF
jgi:tRNA1(Val) A37 N6-methylase TrmN6